MSPDNNTNDAGLDKSADANPEKTILLAEDDPFISRMYQAKLTMAGYNVVLVGDGRSALEYIHDHGPSLAMLDLNMPELSGFEVIKGLENTGYNLDQTKFMILTNSGRPEDHKIAQSMGVDYMTKTEMTPHSVLERIGQLLGDSPSS